MSDSLQPHELQHARLPCPSPCLSLLKFMSIESVMLSNFCCLFSSCPQSFPASGAFLMSQLFASGGQSLGPSALASVLPMKYSGSISFRIDCFDLLAAQGTLKSLLQHHSSEASVLRPSAFFDPQQLSHSYMITGKTITLTGWTFVGKVMTLLFNMLSRLVIAFLPRSKRLLSSWL